MVRKAHLVVLMATMVPLIVKTAVCAVVVIGWIYGFLRVMLTTICAAICHRRHPLLCVCISREDPSDEGRTELGAAVFLLLTRGHDFKLDLLLLFRYEACFCLKLVNDIFEEGELSRKFSIVIVLDSGYQVLISILDASSFDFTIFFQFA